MIEKLLNQLPALIKLSEKLSHRICSGLEGVGQVFLSLEDELRLVFGRWVRMILPGTGLGGIGNGGLLKGSRLGWSDVLIMPIQRLTRYPLFLSGKFFHFFSVSSCMINRDIDLLGNTFLL